MAAFTNLQLLIGEMMDANALVLDDCIRAQIFHGGGIVRVKSYK